MKKFDLTKALNGHPLVMRNGAKVAKFWERKEGDGLPDSIGVFPYCANVTGRLIAFTKSGKSRFYFRGHPYDLFLDDNE